MDDIYIYGTAKLLIDGHGPDAPSHAAKKLEALKGCGDRTGALVWARIGRAIDRLQSKTEEAVI